MRLAWVGPVNPRPTGQSDHTECLLPKLAGSASIDLFLEEYTPSNPHIRATFRFYAYGELPRLASQYDSVIYQIGNNPHHAYIAELIQQVPGILDVHDLVLSHMNSRLAPDLQWFLKYARGAIVHSHHQFRRVRDMYSGPLGVIPLPRSALGLTTASEAYRTRKRLGIPPDVFLILSVGWANPYKRLPLAVNATAALIKRGINAWYIHAGEANSDLRGSLLNLAYQHGLQGRVQIMEWLQPERMDDYIRAADACVNLRFPTVGEVSATALQCMGAGKSVLITPQDSLAEIPNQVCIHIEPTENEQEALNKALIHLYQNPTYKAALGRLAFDYVNTTHAPAVIAEQYLTFLSGLLKGRPVHVSDLPLLRAEILGHLTGVKCRPGNRVTLQIHLRNTGLQVWNGQSGQDSVELVASRFSTVNELIKQNVWRQPLPADVPSLGETKIDTVFRAPWDPGVYIYRIDLVHRERGPFAKHGSKPFEFRVVVRVD